MHRILVGECLGAPVVKFGTHLMGTCNYSVTNFEWLNCFDRRSKPLPYIPK